MGMHKKTFPGSKNKARSLKFMSGNHMITFNFRLAKKIKFMTYVINFIPKIS